MTEFQKLNTIQEWLKDYEFMKAYIKSLEERLPDLATDGMGIDPSKEALSKTYKFSSNVENAVVKYDKLDIPKKIRSTINIINMLENGLEKLTEEEKQIIMHRCIKGEYYYQFCNKLGISVPTAKRKKKRALEKMDIAIFGKQ